MDPALASNQPLTGEHVFTRARVLFICLEDSKQELRRRMRAAMLHHDISAADVHGYLFLTTPKDLRIVTMEDGAPRSSPKPKNGSATSSFYVEQSASKRTTEQGSVESANDMDPGRRAAAQVQAVGGTTATPDITPDFPDEPQYSCTNLPNLP
jgi:hypothetical protein